MRSFVWLLLLSSCASVHTEIVIPSPPSQVWAVLTDASGYKSWNPVFVEAHGVYREGALVTYLLRQPDGQEYRIEVDVANVSDGVELNQCGGPWGILTFDHRWILEPVDGGTKVTQREEYAGIGVWFWDRDWVEPAYARANVALSQEVRRRSSEAQQSTELQEQQ